MDADFIRERITRLRLKKGVSEYKMSYDLGHSRGYINNISSGKTLPSMTEFLAICEYCGVSPSDFFNTGVDDPVFSVELQRRVEKLGEEDRKLVLALAGRLAE